MKSFNSRYLLAKRLRRSLSSNLTNSSTYKKQTSPPFMITQIKKLDLCNDCFNLYGVTMSVDDMALYLALHGYDVLSYENLDIGLELYHVVLGTLVQIPDYEVVTSLETFTTFSDDDKEFLGDLLKRPIFKRN